MNNKNYITPKGYKKMADELELLLRKERPEITAIIQWAASNGDRSENADYIYGKRRLREIDRRINFLQKRLEMAVIVNPLQITSNKVQFGASIHLIDEDGNKKYISIVGEDEIDTKKGHLSWKSPFGNALIGKEIGELVIIKAPTGEIELEIIHIEYREII